MLKGLPILCTIHVLAPTASTTLVDSLRKRFKILDYPIADDSVRITLQTHIPTTPAIRRMSWCCSHTKIGIDAPEQRLDR